MKRWSHLTRRLMTVLLALALSAMWAIPVLADDGAPPPAETPSVESQPAEQTPPAEAQPAEAAPVEAVAVEQLPPAEQLTTEETPAPQENPVELLAQVPEGTQVVVLDENGEAVPLATEEAAQAIKSKDPIWCKTGVAPNPANPACSSNFGTLFDLEAGVTPSANGVIWIQAGDDTSGAAITISGTGDWSTDKNFTLTLNGGWNGTYGSTILNPLTPSVIKQQLLILDWNNTVTLNNITITNVASIGYALEVESNKNIVLNNVDVVSNDAEGAGIFNNDPSLDGTNTGTVTITASTFNDNTGTGLFVNSDRAITLKNVSANGNHLDGAVLDNSTAIYAQPVTLTSVNYFSFNLGGGLEVYSQGAITLSNVTAIYNLGGNGAVLDNCAYDSDNEECNQVFSSAVTLKGASNFSNNGWDGLRVWSSGAITVANIIANDNGSDGGRLGETPDGYGDAYGKGAFLNNWGAWSAKPITMTGTNTFNGNASAGLFAYGWGAIKVNNLTVSGNGSGCDPAETYEPEAICDGAHLDGTGVTLTGYGLFEYNYDDGLEAHSYGSITLNNLYAEENGWWGAFADSYGPASAVNILGTNVFIANSYDGLEIWSEGAVTMYNITANANGSSGDSGNGVYVDNGLKWVYDAILDDWIEVPAAKPVILNGTNVLNDNWSTGLEVHSSGPITTNNVTASFNGEGVYLDTCLYDDPPADCTGLPGKAVTMNGASNINSNYGDGLYIVSLGAIKVNNLTSTFNGGYGAYLDNWWDGALGGLTISGYGNLSGNDYLGLQAYSTGAITLANLSVNSNGDIGAYIANNANKLVPTNVTITGLNRFNDNWYNGLELYTYGTVLLNNVTAISNGEPYDPVTNPDPFGSGVIVDNSGGSLARPVTLAGINIFNGNLEDGLSVTSLGAITVKQVTANGNGGNGAYLDNQWGFLNQNITLSGTTNNFNDNGLIGLLVYSNGNILMSNLTANGNTGDKEPSRGYYAGGAYLDNWSLTATPVNVTLTGFNTFNGNGDTYDFTGSGLFVHSVGAITISNLTANDNQEYGARLDNCWIDTGLCTTLPRPITLTGFATFVNNDVDGLYLSSNGAVSLTRVTADLNTYKGLYVDKATNITITCGSMLYNINDAGYDLFARLAITLRGVYTFGNGAANVSSVPTIITRLCPLP
jgi:hypothetical protein